MAWRGIHLSRPSSLSVEHLALRIDFRDEAGGTFRLPLEDLSYLIIDTTETSLSARLLSALSAHGVLVLGVDATHLPCWISLPWASHYQHGPVLQLQMNASLPTRKQLHAHIIRRKIQAQADTLTALQSPQSQTLRALIPHVRSGDADNTEARAARIYWAALFPKRDFVRQGEDLPNAMLNYGYAIIRSAIARYLCAHGFIPQIGIFHAGADNAFNLADDLIEPYHPFVDLHVFKLLGDTPSTEPLSKDHRRALAQLLEHNVRLDTEIYSIMGAIESTVQSLRTAFESKTAEKLLFPTHMP
jgi:CRISPR-associated protein Cas1